MSKRIAEHTVNEYHVPIVIEPCEEGGYFAQCPDWPSCYAEGETIAEVTKEILGVAQALIEIAQENRQPIPLKRKTTTNAGKFTLTLPVFHEPRFVA